MRVSHANNMNLTSGKKQKSKSFVARFADSSHREYDTNQDMDRGLQHEGNMEVPIRTPNNNIKITSPGKSRGAETLVTFNKSRQTISGDNISSPLASSGQKESRYM